MGGQGPMSLGPWLLSKERDVWIRDFNVTFAQKHVRYTHENQHFKWGEAGFMATYKTAVQRKWQCTPVYPSRWGNERRTHWLAVKRATTRLTSPSPPIQGVLCFWEVKTHYTQALRTTAWQNIGRLMPDCFAERFQQENEEITSQLTICTDFSFRPSQLYSSIMMMTKANV